MRGIESIPDAETIKMLRDYMEKGFLENIIDMFRADPSLWGAVPEMITDERSRVRIGTIALAETYYEEHKDEIRKALPNIALGLKHKEPTIRGDVVFLLSIVGQQGALESLEEAVRVEEHSQIKGEMVGLIEELRASL